jgi:hypothetical protein
MQSKIGAIDALACFGPRGLEDETIRTVSLNDDRYLSLAQ